MRNHKCLRLGFQRESQEQLKKADQIEGVGGAKAAVFHLLRVHDLCVHRSKQQESSQEKTILERGMLKRLCHGLIASFRSHFGGCRKDVLTSRRYAQVFKDMGVDGATLLELEEKDLLEDFGVSVRVHRVRIVEEVHLRFNLSSVIRWDSFAGAVE